MDMLYFLAFGTFFMKWNRNYSLFSFKNVSIFSQSFTETLSNNKWSVDKSTLPYERAFGEHSSKFK